MLYAFILEIMVMRKGSKPTKDRLYFYIMELRIGVNFSLFFYLPIYVIVPIIFDIFENPGECIYFYRYWHQNYVRFKMKNRMLFLKVTMTKK